MAGIADIGVETVTGLLADSDAEHDDSRVYAQHQAILTVVHGILDVHNGSTYRWLDLACGKGQIITHLDKHLSEAARKKIAFFALDANVTFLRLFEEKANSLGLGEIHTKVSELQDFHRHYDDNDRFDLITLINAVHELSPTSLADLLYDAILRLSSDGLLFIYDMEALPIDRLELGAITWSQPEVQNLVNAFFQSLGTTDYRPTVGQWPHRTCNGWHLQIRKSGIKLTDDQLRQKRQEVVPIVRGAVREILQRKQRQCMEVLRSLTKFPEENAEEENQSMRQLYDYWALNLGLESFQ